VGGGGAEMPAPPIPPSSYLAGSNLQQTKRLNNIITYTNDNSIRTYDLEYQYYGIPKKSQLTSIQEWASVILFTAQSLTMDLPCASILESSVLPYS
jgi:hypothetical protein